LLLIDDEADVQYSFRRIFESSDLEITTCDSGESALKTIPRLNPIWSSWISASAA
jgi:CheY-like chemotaxis protein